MNLNELRRRVAAAIAPEPEWQRNEYVERREPYAHELEPLDAPPLPPDPSVAQPLTVDQRANLEALRDRYAPDRQHPPT